MRSLHSISAAFCTLILASCGEQDAESEGGDLDRGWHVLSAVDSTLIVEGDDAYIGDPFNMVLVPDSAGLDHDEIWISDFFSKSLLHFDGDGGFVKRVGSPGPGPAEFSLPHLVFRTEDGQVVADDHRQRTLKWFDAETGELNTTLRYDTGMVGASVPVTVEGEAEQPLYIFPFADYGSQTSLGAVDPESGTMERFGALPKRHREALSRNAAWYASFFGASALVGLEAGTVLSVFGGDETLLIHDLEERVSRPLGAVPARFRRGVEHECVLLGFSDDLSDCGSPFATYYLDTVRVGEGGASRLRGRSFVTLLDAKTDMACVDLVVPVSDEVRAIFTVQGNDLHALDRRLLGTRTENWLLRFGLPEIEGCPAQHRVEGWLAGAGP